VKRFILLVVFASLTAVAQKGFETTISAEPINLHASSTDAYVQGHWVAQDKQSELTGPSVSEISCDRQTRTCHESQANIMVMGNTFSLSADSVDYKVERWNEKEIVAKNIGGLCRILNVLKFDLVQKRVYAFQTLSEPTNDLPKLSKEICAHANMNLELKADTMWRK
jgi:hypothetical protein